MAWLGRDLPTSGSELAIVTGLRQLAAFYSLPSRAESSPHAAVTAVSAMPQATSAATRGKVHPWITAWFVKAYVP
jgi:hypothetical protein